jgi:hypothetical protein
MMKIGVLRKSKLRHPFFGVTLLLSPLCILLVACGTETEETGAGGLNPQDAEALDEAATKLDAENASVPVIVPIQNSAQQPDQSAAIQKSANKTDSAVTEKTQPTK